MTFFTVTRQITIDAGHRVMTHDSKCRHLHGHSYRIEMTCCSKYLQTVGKQSAMVLDFSFLKEAMLTEINVPCDHGFLAYFKDFELLHMFCHKNINIKEWISTIEHAINQDGYYLTSETQMKTKLYVMNVNPTAEQLCRHWFERLAPIVKSKSNSLAYLKKIVVWETQNCRATYHSS
ncbi:MAG: 6-carboxytetrahydropterin synthase [Rhodospirillaceae bacterium]|jgi:6-pyruvoyltetrahydropterin/6-carboxytetrahydropterin synthase|nr:6-carboxytetrahydropterin synthase [Rhodospirillaceae bacterium]